MILITMTVTSTAFTTARNNHFLRLGFDPMVICLRNQRTSPRNKLKFVLDSTFTTPK